VLDPVDYIKEMQPAANSFLNNNLNTAVFEQVYNRMMVKSMFKNYLVKADNYADPKPLTQEELDEMSAEANAAILAMGSIDTELGPNETNEDDPTEEPTEEPEGIKNFNKKNLFTVTPVQAADKKATIKASIATQFIGFGEGISGSSTELYRQQAGALANTGNYSADDVVFVSVPGKRGDAAIAKREQDKTIKEAIKAVEAGATILTDNKAYTDASTYNTGEKRLYANMEAKGYNYSEITVDNQVIGTWSKPTQPSTTLPGPETKINIYAGTGENAELSNFAVRPFEGGKVKTNYQTVEGAFQASKLSYTSLTLAEKLPFVNALSKATGAEARKIGKQIPGLNTKGWDENSSEIMKKLLLESFEQNPDALAKLLATGNATLTHTQDKGKWGTEFPKLLMEVRNELKDAQPSTQSIEEDFNLNITDQITILEAELADLEDMKQGMLERSIPVLIATNLPKIKPDSARRETGTGVGTAKDINPGMLSNNDVSVERAAEMLSENLFYEGSGFPEIDVQEIRDYIIDILQTGVKNYVDEFTDQNKIDNVKAKIAELKQEKQNAADANTGIQLNLFGDMNAPEGYPSIPRTPKDCQ
jgi:predicted NAD-dependent protein-ADP-ribosyltransferase YbiA (DUF1768 family)